MTLFRPCIDLHNGVVKQIVGGSLSEDPSILQTNFESKLPAEYYADLYKKDHLYGGHVIMLGPGNEHAATAALKAFPGGLQVGGGIHINNAPFYLEAGASHVIVTSWLFDHDGNFIPERIKQLEATVGKKRIVIDLSCRKKTDGWIVTMNRWTTLTNLSVTNNTLDDLAQYADEFLIHAVDVEGLCQGVDTDLIEYLADWGRIPITYAGGAKSIDDLQQVEQLSDGKVDLAIGSALDLFGGILIRYADCLSFNNRRK